MHALIIIVIIIIIVVITCLSIRVHFKEKLATAAGKLFPPTTARERALSLSRSHPHHCVNLYALKTVVCPPPTFLPPSKNRHTLEM